MNERLCEELFEGDLVEAARVEAAGCICNSTRQNRSEGSVSRFDW